MTYSHNIAQQNVLCLSSYDIPKQHIMPYTYLHTYSTSFVSIGNHVGAYVQHVMHDVGGNDLCIDHSEVIGNGVIK